MQKKNYHWEIPPYPILNLFKRLIRYLKLKDYLPFCISLKEAKERKTKTEKGKNDKHCNHATSILFLHVTNIKNLLWLFRNSLYSIELIAKISLFQGFFEILLFILFICIFQLFLALPFGWRFFRRLFRFMFSWGLFLNNIFLLLHKVIKIIDSIQLTFSIKKRSFRFVLDKETRGLFIFEIIDRELFILILDKLYFGILITFWQ